MQTVRCSSIVAVDSKESPLQLKTLGTLLFQVLNRLSSEMMQSKHM